MSDVHPDPSHVFARRLAIIVALGAIWRFAVLVVDKWQQPLLLNDSIYYSGQAQQLARGIWFREIFVDQPGAEHGPLTSILLSPVSWVDDPVPWQRVVTVLCGIATLVAIGVLGRRLGGDRVGLVAAAIAAAYPNLWMNDGLVMSESLSMLLVTLVLVVAHRAFDAPGWRPAVAVGALSGLAMLARSELALLVPGLALLLWWFRPPDVAARPWTSRAQRPLLVVGAAVLVVSPWVVFNLARFERPVTLTTNDGTTLLGSYCDDAFVGPHMGGWSLLCVVNDPDYAIDEEPSIRSARQRSMAVDYMGDHLDRLPLVVAARLGRTLDLYGLQSLVAQDVGEERYRWASWAGIVAWWALAIAAVAGFVRLPRRERCLLALPVVAVLVTTVVFYGGHRIRSSLEPVVVVCAAIAFVAAWSRWRRRLIDESTSREDAASSLAAGG